MAVLARATGARVGLSRYPGQAQLDGFAPPGQATRCHSLSHSLSLSVALAVGALRQPPPPFRMPAMEPFRNFHRMVCSYDPAVTAARSWFYWLDPEHDAECSSSSSP